MFDIIKSQVSLLDEVEKSLSLTFRQMGEKNWVIDGDKDVEACPFCGHHDCFRISHIEGDNQSSFYKCFSCGEHGDVVTWRSKRNNVSLGEALRQLASENGIEMPREANPIQQIFNLAADYYHQCLVETCDRPWPFLDGRTPLQYQTEVRKRNPVSLKKYKIGFSDGGLVEYLTSLGIEEDLILESGLGRKKSKDSVVKDFLPKNCFIYPHFVKGRPSHFTFKDSTKRTPDYQLPKKYDLNGYLFYGQDTIKDAPFVTLVEGENDWLSVMETGASPATLAMIGQISKEQLDWLTSFCKEKALLTMFDPDDAGNKYRQKIEALRGFFKSIVHILPPEGKDIDEHLSNGASIREIIKNNRVEVVLPQKESEVDWEEKLSELGLEDVGSVIAAPSRNTIPLPLPPIGITPPAGEPSPETLGVTDDLVIKVEAEVVGPAVTHGYFPVVDSESNAPSPYEDEENPEAAVQLEDCNIKQKNGCYYKIRVSKDGNVEYIRLSNFTLKLMNVYVNDGKDRLREVVLTRADGKKSKPFTINSETKVSVKAFKVEVARQLDCEWLGRDADLDAMWAIVYSQSKEREIRVPEVVGRFSEGKNWLFKNVMITESGQVVTPDSNGVFWPGRGEGGVKPQGIDEEGEKDGMPSLPFTLPPDAQEELLESAVRQLAANLGDPGMACLALGWVKACVYSDFIFKANNGFGILVLWGNKGDGKSTIASWLQAIFGLGDKMASTSVQQLKTAVGFQRKGEYYSSLPMFLDELRNDETSHSHLGMIRSWYDREGRALGVANKFGVRNQQIRAALILGGEDLPMDPATRERCINLRVKKNGREKIKSYEWFQGNKEALGSIGFKWILESTTPGKIQEVLEGIKSLDKELASSGCSARISKVWSSAAYFAQEMCDKYFPEFEFHKFLIGTSMEEHTHQNSDSTLSMFLEYVEILRAAGVGGRESEITSKHILVDEKDQLVHIWFPPVFESVRRFASSRGMEFSRNAVLRSLKEEPYFVSDSKKVAMGLDGTRRVVVSLDLTKAPDVVKNIAERNQ